MSHQHVHETAIIELPVDVVWKVVRPLDFTCFNPNVVTSTIEGKDGPYDVGGLRTVVYKDKTSQSVKLMELSDGNKRVSWDLISSEPKANTLGASFTIHLRRVTASNFTYISWTVDFSHDADIHVYKDAVFKAKENFAHLKKVAKKNLVAESKNDTSATGPPALLRKLSDRSATLKKVFEEYDKNKSGRLEFEEFKALVTKMDIFGSGRALPDTVLHVLLAEADENEDGVNYENLVKFLDVKSSQK